jgi:CBS domain-containing protein
MELAPKVMQLVVVDAAGKLAGAVHMHDLFRAQVI